MLKIFLGVVLLSLSVFSMDTDKETESHKKTQENIQAISQAIAKQKEIRRIDNAARIFQAGCMFRNWQKSSWEYLKEKFGDRIGPGPEEHEGDTTISEVIVRQKKLNTLHDVISIRKAVSQACPLLFTEINEEAPNYTSVAKTYLRINDEDAERKKEVPPRFYDIISGSESLEDAKIILLGENHENLNHMTINSLIIDMLAETGDIVLLEGSASDAGLDQDCFSLTFTVSVKLKISGWENMDAHKRAGALIDKRKELGEELKQKAEVMGSNITFYETEVKNSLSEFILLYESMDQTVLFERNDYLMESVVSQVIKNPGKRVFVQMGLNHITKDPRVGELLSAFGFIAIKPRD